MQIDHLLVQLADSKACADLLDDWHWLTGSKKRPFLLTASGNAFVHDIGDGTVDLLDVSAACLSRVADTREGFHELLQTPSFASVVAVDSHRHPSGGWDPSYVGRTIVSSLDAQNGSQPPLG